MACALCKTEMKRMIRTIQPNILYIRNNKSPNRTLLGEKEHGNLIEQGSYDSLANSLMTISGMCHQTENISCIFLFGS